MLNIRKKTDYKTVLIYLTLTLFFLLFAKLGGETSIYGVSVFAAALSLGANPYLTPLLFLSSFLCLGKFSLLASAAIAAVFLSVCAVIYGALKARIRYELFLFAAISLVGFMIIGDTSINLSVENRIMTSLITVFLTPICRIALSAVKNKGLKFKLAYEESASIAVFAAVLGLGISNLLSPEVFKGVSVFTILICAYLFKTGSTSLIACVLGISLSVYYGRIEYTAVLLVWSVFAECLMPLSRFVSAISVPFCDYVMQTVFSVYPEYALFQILSVCIGALLFCLLPNPFLKNLKEKLYAFREKQLVRESINRNRLMTSNRLLELSGVFTEISGAFSFLKKESTSEERIKSSMESKIVSEVCLNCENVNRCKEKGCPKRSDVKKLIDIGLAKGRLSLIDMPKDVASFCIHPNNILYGLNKMLAEYRAHKTDALNFKNGRDLLAKEAEGISEILRGLALDTGTLLKYQSRLERSLSDELFKNGFNVSELLIYGENLTTSVSLILSGADFDAEKIAKIISKTVKLNMVLCEKADISPSKYYLSFKKSADYDAVFGIACCVKEGKSVSGDTHAVTKIKDDRFLIALSDGMGSGKKAETVSSVSLSLIESFYKAGLESGLILNTVNKLLAINSEDSFTALDVAVVDLKNCRADFIKYGCPYGFIITQAGIKIVEGNNLPLGILEDLSPAVCSAPLSDGDMILMLSDGISDSFGSSSEIVDFLRSVPAFNPQSLADEILKKAVENYGGEKKDDMTALAVRIFKPVHTA